MKSRQEADIVDCSVTRMKQRAIDVSERRLEYGKPRLIEPDRRWTGERRSRLREIRDLEKSVDRPQGGVRGL